MKPLWQRGLNLLTALAAPMENHHLPLLDKLVLRKRSSIETLFAQLKRGMGLSTAAIALPSMALSISLLPGPTKVNIGTIAVSSFS